MIKPVSSRARRFFGLLGAVLPLALLACAADKGSSRADEPDIPVRITRAKVGEWALYRQANGDLLRFTVVEKQERSGHTYLMIEKRVTTANGKKRRPSQEEVDVAEAAERLRYLAPDDTVTTAEVLVRERSMDAVVVNHVDNGVLTRQSYLSAEVPVHGLIRGVSIKGTEKTVALSLIDYGYSNEMIQE